MIRITYLTSGDHDTYKLPVIGTNSRHALMQTGSKVFSFVGYATEDSDETLHDITRELFLYGLLQRMASHAFVFLEYLLIENCISISSIIGLSPSLSLSRFIVPVLIVDSCADIESY